MARCWPLPLFLCLPSTDFIFVQSMTIHQLGWTRMYLWTFVWLTLTCCLCFTASRFYQILGVQLFSKSFDFHQYKTCQLNSCQHKCSHFDYCHYQVCSTLRSFGVFETLVKIMVYLRLEIWCLSFGLLSDGFSVPGNRGLRRCTYFWFSGFSCKAGI